MTTESRNKLDRMPTTWVGGHYTTGDAQHWTYEYTWEDVFAIVEFRANSSFMDPSNQPSKYDLRIFDRIVDYFKEHPQEYQKLLESEILAEKGLGLRFERAVDFSGTIFK